MEATVYWLHLPTHNDILSEGYVGVSVNPERRIARHFSAANSAYHENPHLLNAIVKSGNTIIQDTVASGSEEYCYRLEAKLRPQKDIGWNIAEGGGPPPNRKGRPSGFKGWNHTEEEKQRRRERYSGEGNPFFGKKHTEDSKIRMGHPTGHTPWNKGLKLGPQSPDHIQKRVESNIGKHSFPEWNVRDWIVTDPNGEVYNIRNLKQFCLDNKLNTGMMCLVAQGKRRHYKKWICRKEGVK